MTLNFERYNAVNSAREFLWDLMNPSKTKRVPLEIRRRARSIAKHFPTEHDMMTIFPANYIGSDLSIEIKQRKKK